MSEFQVFSRELFKMPERIPAPNGCLDPRLGVSDKSAVCETCRWGLSDAISGRGPLAFTYVHAPHIYMPRSCVGCVCVDLRRKKREAENDDDSIW